VIGWAKPEKADYDFFNSRSWAKGASEELLNGGCLYEYARESRKYRCWLVLRHAPKQEHFWSPPLVEFEGNSAGHVHLLDSGWERWLNDFADELIANESFAEVSRKNPTKVKESLVKLAGYSLYPKAIELPGRYINYPGSQDVLIQVCWRQYTNEEIGEEMKKFAASNRPETEPESERRGKKRQSKVRADLKALSVLRIWKLHEGKPWKRLQEIAAVCGYEGCVREAAEYKQRSKRGHAVEPISRQAKKEMSGARTRALSFFQRLFPWGKPSNY
jgi:hypothetical protein